MEMVGRTDNITYMTNFTNDVTGTDITVGPSRLSTSIGAAVMFAFFIEGLIGNLWVPAAILTQRKVWNVINVFIVSLCLNDLLVLCLIVILIIDSYIWQKWTAGMTMCKLNPEFTVAFAGCALWHSAFIAIHRYIVVVHNTTYKRMKKKVYVIFVLFSTRMIPIAVTIPGFSLETSGYVPKLLRCILLPNEKRRIISVTIVQIIAPIIIILICYALVFGYVCHIGHRISNSNFLMKREIQITKMFGVIFLMILIGFVPYALVRNMDSHNNLNGNIYVIVTVFYGIGTCANPLVYGAMSTEVRRACIECIREFLFFIHCENYFPCLKTPIQSDADMTTFGVTESRPQSNEQNCIKLPLNGNAGEDPPPREV